MAVSASRAVSVVAFFIAGLVIAVGGALIYSIAHGLNQPIQQTQTAVQVQHVASLKPSPVTSNVAKFSAQALARSQGESISPLGARSKVKLGGKTTASVAKARPRNVNTRAPQIARQMPTSAQPLWPETRPGMYGLGSQPLPPQQHVLTLEPGTAIAIELREKLSTNYDNTGDTFRGVLAEPVEVGGLVIADTGSMVAGEIEYAHRAGLFGGESGLLLTLTEIHTNDSRILALRTDSCKETGAPTNVKKSAKLAAGLAAGAVMRAVSGATRATGFSSVFDEGFATNQAKIDLRRSVVLPVGTKLIFHLAAPVPIREQLSVRSRSAIFLRN